MRYQQKKQARGMSPVIDTSIETDPELRRKVISNMNNTYAKRFVSQRNVEVQILPRKSFAEPANSQVKDYKLTCRS